MAQYTDLTYLKEITGGEKEIVTEMIQMFIEQVAEFKENMAKHLGDGNWVELGKEAHKAKSSVLIVGMEELGKNLKKLQLLTEELKNIDSYPSFVEEFNLQCDAAVIELTKELEIL